MDPFIGEIRLFGFGFAPVGWATCQGQTMSIMQYSALFSLLGTTYGGDGVQTFNLPNLQGQAPIGSGPEYTLGQTASHIEIGQPTEPTNAWPGYLALNWCIALEGVYPSRP